MNTPSTAGVRRAACGLASMACLALLTGCGTLLFGSKDAHLEPDDPGLYAVVEDDELMRLDGNPEWENETWKQRSALHNDIRFVVYDERLGRIGRPLGSVIGLYRVAWVRSRIAEDGKIMPNTQQTWNVTTTEPFQVPVHMRHLDDRDEMALITPKGPLEDGLYSLRLETDGGARYARLGVNWQAMDRDRYAAENCVDEYLDESGRHAGFRPCQEQGMSSDGGLRVHLVAPRMETVNNAERLVVEGVVVNTSGQGKTIPPLNAAVRGQDGKTIRTWTFRVDPADVEPGGSTAFRTVLENPPGGIKSVNVTFPQDVATEGR